LRYKARSLLIITGLLLLAGWVLNYINLSILCLENIDRSKSYPIRVSPSERFALVYIHSIYNEPVEEIFQTHEGIIFLKEVKARHPGILEYYGFDDVKESHSFDRRIGIPIFRVATGEPQSLLVRDIKISFKEIGERGDRIRLSFKSVSLGHYLFYRYFVSSHS
jgi:hypothetical protein